MSGGQWYPNGVPTNDPDSFAGSDGQDVADGLGGNDTISGFGGGDLLLGGDGDDSLIGGEGADQLIGGPGSDTYYWSPGDGDDAVDGDADDFIVINAEGYTTQPGAGGATEVHVGDEFFTVFDVPVDNIVIVCFLEGTRIMTARGEVPVEQLRVGELVVSPESGRAALQPVVWLGHARTPVARHPDPQRVAPIRIAAGALADGVPCRDLRVSPEHALFLDGHLVPAKYLVDGIGIVQETTQEAVTYWHVELPEHGLLLAEGAAAESYFEDSNRQYFDAPGVTLLVTDFAPGGRYDTEACHPVLRDGPVLEVLRRRIASRRAAVVKPAAA